MRQLEQLLNQAKKLAKEYRALTGKPLGITGEVAEFYAAKYIKGFLKLEPARTPGYDAKQKEGNKTVLVQIKGRCIPNDAKPGQRIGSIKLNKDWDRLVLVLMDEDFEITKIIKAERHDVERELKAPGSKARNERGALSISKFIRIGDTLWPR